MNDKSTQNMLLIFLGIVVLWYLLDPNRGCVEHWDPTVSEFVPLGARRHDLRGYPLRTRSTDHLYRSNNRNIMLSDSCGEIFDSDSPPSGQGYRKVPCPPNGEYDPEDTCWKYTPPKSSEPTTGCLSCPSARSILGRQR